MWQDSGRCEWPLTGALGDSTALDTRPYPEKARHEIAELRAEVETLRARVVELEQAAERHAGTL
jgi:hypothetical protein